MGTEKGGTLPELGGKLHHSQNDVDARPRHASLLTEALRREARRERGAVKRLMRWSGASEGAVKAWLRGDSQPRADHLIALMAHSDQILAAVLTAADRTSAMPIAEIIAARRLVHEAAQKLDALAVGL
ncbi:hypothetical protein GWK16_24630 [Roseomonas sp. JC162]|uniref:XRE family transcriptional regulator n=1 Tax=Neoroseomonas marina TaxID=1232220 RepID=A0A848EIE2_9PROT|nr:hypothetical protein [Neoroseomonas marina]NMJ44454.1 hypothetical protein [Neoroseomonas marina]